MTLFLIFRTVVWPAFRSRSLGASDGIHTYLFVGIARPRKRVARIRSPTVYLMIGLHTDLAPSMGSPLGSLSA